ncbi:hypothetical protein [Cutibacterium avidum]|uniref:hypothetical protein n=1 Tax=Cutibacterium avidum TaxID=33010 RepID=UPI003366E9C4
MVTYFVQDDSGCISSFSSIENLVDYLEPGYEDEIGMICDSEGNKFQFVQGVIVSVMGERLSPAQMGRLLAGDYPSTEEIPALRELIAWHEKNSVIL